MEVSALAFHLRLLDHLPAHSPPSPGFSPTRYYEETAPGGRPGWQELPGPCVYLSSLCPPTPPCSVGTTVASSLSPHQTTCPRALAHAALPECSASDTHSLGQSSRPTAGNLRPREQEPVRVGDSQVMSSQAVLWKLTMDAMVPVPTGGLLGLRLARLAARGCPGSQLPQACPPPLQGPLVGNVPAPGLGRRGMGVGRGEGRRAASSQRLHCHRTRDTAAREQCRPFRNWTSCWGPTALARWVGRRAGVRLTWRHSEGFAGRAWPKCRQSDRPCESRKGNRGTGRACPSRGVRCPRPSVLPPAPSRGQRRWPGSLPRPHPAQPQEQLPLQRVQDIN